MIVDLYQEVIERLDRGQNFSNENSVVNKQILDLKSNYKELLKKFEAVKQMQKADECEF